MATVVVVEIGAQLNVKHLRESVDRKAEEKREHCEVTQPVREHGCGQ